MERAVLILILILLLLIVFSCIKVVPQANAYIVERLGAFQNTVYRAGGKKGEAEGTGGGFPAAAGDHKG